MFYHKMIKLNNLHYMMIKSTIKHTQFIIKHKESELIQIELLSLIKIKLAQIHQKLTTITHKLIDKYHH